MIRLLRSFSVSRLIAAPKIQAKEDLDEATAMWVLVVDEDCDGQDMREVVRRSFQQNNCVILKYNF